eukprot:CAMPEP_0171926116 /NCGR_PEP_ID=MMETSP0993-20121228/24657_1 /TAXON_ID=483369 /ORGANISM="non described non described, Strain CCMP2098" /LENGTH=442 /DNA_ID=CAMNT_0012564911 /DNA_START=53 /DNA_END=1381 /DNA_ORIENTATION=+
MPRRGLFGLLFLQFVTSDEWGFVLPPVPRVLYSLDIHGTEKSGSNQELVGTLRVLEGVEVADTAGAFCGTHGLPRSQRDAIIQHICGSAADGKGGIAQQQKLQSSNKATSVLLTPGDPDSVENGTVDWSEQGGALRVPLKVPAPSGSTGAGSTTSDRNDDWREIKCSRRRPKRFLFDFSVRDTLLKDPIFVQVYDSDDTAKVARKACELLPACRAESKRTILLRNQPHLQQQHNEQELIVSSSSSSSGTKQSANSDASKKAVGAVAAVGGMEMEIRNKVLTQQRIHLEREVRDEACLYTRLGLEVPPLAREVGLWQQTGASASAVVGGGEVRKAFLARSLILHPDKPGGDAELFMLAQDAYAVLGDKSARRDYDMRHGLATTDSLSAAAQDFHSSEYAMAVDERQAFEESVGFMSREQVQNIKRAFPGASVTTNGLDVFITM